VARASKYFSCFFSLNNNNNKKLVFDVFDWSRLLLFSDNNLWFFSVVWMDMMRCKLVYLFK
jgi:hypothetical protein